MPKAGLNYFKVFKIVLHKPLEPLNLAAHLLSGSAASQASTWLILALVLHNCTCQRHQAGIPLASCERKTRACFCSLTDLSLHWTCWILLHLTTVSRILQVWLPGLGEWFLLWVAWSWHGCPNPEATWHGLHWGPSPQVCYNFSLATMDRNCTDPIPAC